MSSSETDYISRAHPKLGPQKKQEPQYIWWHVLSQVCGESLQPLPDNPKLIPRYPGHCKRQVCRQLK
jgi:hypothetical protein